MIPVKVTKISYHSESKSYAVILKEITGEKCLPVIVGSFEAQSIALAIETVDTPRPLTHDLICDLISGVDGVLNAVRINSLDEGVFFSQLEIESIKLGKRIIDATAEKINLDKNKVLMNIENYGNTTAATIPLLMYDYEKNLNEGDKLILAAFGAGLTWGAAYLTWAYN